MNYKLHKLPNGVRLITVPIKDGPSATLTIWVNTGSRNESDKIAGLSHFLEHMVFKGGKKRTTAAEIAETVDAIGGEFNASTSKEWTNFYIKARSGNIDLAYDVLSDMVLTPRLDKDAMEREKGVIIEEIAMYEDTPLWKIEDLFENVVYQGHQLARDIIGSPTTVKGLTREDFVSYRDMHYFPENIVVTVAGGVTEKKALELTKKYFGSIKTPKLKNSKTLNKFKSSQTKPRVLLSNKQKDQAHFILGFRGSELDSSDRFIETLLATILGGGMSSRLWSEIREKRGLAYTVRGSRDTYTDAGYIGVYAGVDPKKIEDALKVTLEQCYGLASGKYPIKNIELKKSKEFLKGHIALSLEDTRSINSFFGVKQLLLGKNETPEEVFALLDKVTAKEIVDVAKKNFKKDRLNLAIIGPYKDAAVFEKLLK